MSASRPYLLSGSFAYDTILRHSRHFHESILPEALSKLNVAFDIASVKNEFGGTAGNIAYNASLLGQSPLLVGCLGHDSNDYLNWLRKNGLDESTLTLAADEGCAHAWITSDASDNQITSFSMGAMRQVPAVPKETPNLWHLAPENPITTATLAREAVSLGKSFFFDPGQVLPAFIAGAGSDIFSLESLLTHATGIFVNDYEADLLISATGVPLEHWLRKPGQFILRTRGGKGLMLSVLRDAGALETTHLWVAPAEAIVDPTGCGDALRAGFLKSYSESWRLEQCAAMGAVMGSFAIERNGGQNHRPTHDEITARYQAFCKEADIFDDDTLLASLPAVSTGKYAMSKELCRRLAKMEEDAGDPNLSIGPTLGV